MPAMGLTTPAALPQDDTHMYVDWKRGLVTVYMVQHAGFPGEGKRGLDVFRAAAEAAFGR
ncbi:MAG: hypothetical protein BWK77_06755 [Verrucomicrobia bacterium A1]|nr:MAG: hypothetical protein BWK77_06755 [Verrucomicrobia bacterium A1]